MKYFRNKGVKCRRKGCLNGAVTKRFCAQHYAQLPRQKALQKKYRKQERVKINLRAYKRKWYANNNERLSRERRLNRENQVRAGVETAFRKFGITLKNMPSVKEIARNAPEVFS